MSKLFGAQLLVERKKQSLTVQKVAKACKVSRSYITLIENNKRLPGKKLIPRIALALNIKTSVVLNWYLEDIGEKIRRGL